MDDLGNALLKKHHDAHVAYWSAKGGEGYDVNRFDEGFRSGWEDALQGATDDSKLEERKEQHIASWGPSPVIWEWEHGYKEAITAKTSGEQP
ncbi:hypothetical protein CALVIDRAFT_560957 [Calocera viscosa TUFC12733]|uniref:Uncharacterized protein n=1 Tax=Calocera viscosa (strain TUFC12733) TaxID=1330018 RepID=A0A167QBW1_CALVF|nr:hypothetical protein CALVIDRAFT_560957 [Calocera viscosa TUFC12733]